MHAASSAQRQHNYVEFSIQRYNVCVYMNNTESKAWNFWEYQQELEVCFHFAYKYDDDPLNIYIIIMRSLLGRELVMVSLIRGEFIAVGNLLSYINIIYLKKLTPHHSTAHILDL